jgi:hypothetical protein
LFVNDPGNPEVKQTAPPAEKKKKKGEVFYLLLIFLLLCSNGALGWLWWKDKRSLHIITIEKETVAKDAEIIKQQLITLSTQYENLKVNDLAMQAEVDAKKNEIAAFQRELEKNKDNIYIIAKLKKETQTLRDIMQHFVIELDSLNTLNKHIVADHEKVKKELTEEKEINTQLTKEKTDLQNTVNLASMLKAVGLSASGINEKKGGKKESETKRSKHTDKIKISFVLAENLIAKQGERTIYARIISPDGKEITQANDSTHVFMFGKSKGYWATKKKITYSNENTEVILYAHAKQGDVFMQGKYIIEVNTDGATIGNTILELE